MISTLPVLAALLLALFAYRSGRVAWHNILTTPDLPDAYYAGGNWSTHCALVHDDPDIAYCEDIVFWDHHDAHGALADRLVLLSCDPNRKAWNTVMGPLRDPGPRGHLFLYAPATRTVQRITLDGYPPAHDFHPLGLDVTPARPGVPSHLFVVNHARAGTTVELFALDPAHPTRAQHLRTLSAPAAAFAAANALALTGPTSFFVSNDHAFTRRDWRALPLPLVESVAALPLGWVAHVALDPETGAVTGTTVAARGIAFANGLARAPDGAHLAVASTSLGVVHVYAVDPDTHALALAHSVPVPFFPDNVAYDDDGALIVAGHPQFPALVRVAANATGVYAPSWAVSVTPGSGGGEMYDTRAPLSASKLAPAVSSHVVETLFQSDGSVFGTSSTALRDARTGAIYVAGLYEHGILECRP